MRKLKFIVLMMFLTGIMVSFSSCLVTRRHDNGLHRGWFHKQDKHHYDSGRTVRLYENKNHKKPTIVKHKNSKNQ